MVTTETKPTYLRLRESKKLIMHLWEQTARQEIQAAHGKSSLAVVNSLPLFLDNLAEALNPKTRIEIATEDNNISIEHGIQRALIGEYDIDQVMSEYEILQTCILQILENQAPLNGSEVKIISASVQSASRESVLAFVQILEGQKKETEKQFQLLVGEVRDYAIFMLDPHGRILTWNEGARQIKGYEAQEALGHYFGFLYREEDARNGKPEHNLKLAREHGRFEEQFWRRRKDGTLYWADITITSLYDHDGQFLGFSKVVRDLTEKKRVETELRAAKEAAETANNLKTAFLANMSHEIRTPLGVILGFTEILKDPDADEEEKQQCFRIIERNGKVLTRLIEDILDLSKIEAGKLEVENIDVNMRHLLSDVSGYFEIQARDKGIVYEAGVSPDFPQYIRTDPVRLRQILNNLIGNAVKFTSQGSVKVEVKYQSHLLHGNQVEIKVQDTGIGIPMEKRERLFRPFSQADSSTTRQYGGTGLGLALSKRIANELGGDISLEDCPHGKGCVFRVHFSDRKLKVDEKNSAILRSLGYGEENDHSADHEGALQGKKILLAEDTQDNQILIQRILNRMGANLEIATNGEEAVFKALHGSFDLVLMDVQMPILDGNEASRRLRAHGFQKPIIAVTAHAMEDQRKEILKSGIDDCVTKPVTQKELLNKVTRHLTGAYLAEHPQQF